MNINSKGTEKDGMGYALNEVVSLIELLIRKGF